MKKIISLISLTVICLTVGIVLSGCGPTKVKPAAIHITTSTAGNPATQPTLGEEIKAVQTSPTADITDVSLEADLNGLDAQMETIKSTGFEQTDLSDKDLGL